MATIVTLITDYGTRDYYVGALKGAILGIAPEVTIVDVTHDIQPHNILAGAFVLRQTWSCFPPGTIHLVVVDPGVGTQRRIVLGAYAGRFVIAPDNGLLTLVHRDLPAESLRVVECERFFMTEVSCTFHGRDIMAPVAAHLANGVAPSEFGPAAEKIEVLPDLEWAECLDNGICGRVLYVDRFGTMVTNIRHEQLKGASSRTHPGEVRVNGISIGPIRTTFADVVPGAPLALLGSTGLLEIAVNQGNAAERFKPTASVRVDVQNR